MILSTTFSLSLPQYAHCANRPAKSANLCISAYHVCRAFITWTGTWVAKSSVLRKCTAMQHSLCHPHPAHKVLKESAFNVLNCVNNARPTVYAYHAMLLGIWSIWRKTSAKRAAVTGTTFRMIPTLTTLSTVISASTTASPVPHPTLASSVSLPTSTKTNV